MTATNTEVDKLIRFQRPGRALPYARSLTDATVAAIIGTDETTYVQTLARLEAQRSRAARELAGEADVRGQLDRLPFARGQRIVAIGEIRQLTVSPGSRSCVFSYHRRARISN